MVSIIADDTSVLKSITVEIPDYASLMRLGFELGEKENVIIMKNLNDFIG